MPESSMEILHLQSRMQITPAKIRQPISLNIRWDNKKVWEEAGSTMIDYCLLLCLGIGVPIYSSGGVGTFVCTYMRTYIVHIIRN